MNSHPDADGRLGKFDGKYVQEVLTQPLAELETALREA